MADVTPNWEVELMKLDRQEMQILLNVQDGKIRLIELQREKERIEENIAASEEGLADIKERKKEIHSPSKEPPPKE